MGESNKLLLGKKKFKELEKCNICCKYLIFMGCVDRLYYVLWYVLNLFFFVNVRFILVWLLFEVVFSDDIVGCLFIVIYILDLFVICLMIMCKLIFVVLFERVNVFLLFMLWLVILNELLVVLSDVKVIIIVSNVIFLVLMFI